jgi:dephospho-CoA kinase
VSSPFPIPVIGLTGGIASGKSLVAKILREKANIPVLDADRISRDLSSPNGAAESAILNAFGTLDRAQLRKRIFGDAGARAQLEAILHPLIRTESIREISDLARAGATLAFYEATLLVETGRYRDFDGLLVVEAPLETRISRLMERDAASRGQAEAVIAAQATDDARRNAATWVIENSHTTEELENRVLELLPEIFSHVGTGRQVTP